MPRLVKAYACVWNCRRRVTSARTGMLSHELRCKNNPDAKACATCVHQGYEPGDAADHSTGDPGQAGGWFCEIDKLPEGRMMVYQCPFWAGKIVNPNAPPICEEDCAEMI